MHIMCQNFIHTAPFLLQTLLLYTCVNSTTTLLPFLSSTDTLMLATLLNLLIKCIFSSCSLASFYFLFKVTPRLSKSLKQKLTSTYIPLVNSKAVFLLHFLLPIICNSFKRQVSGPLKLWLCLQTLISNLSLIVGRSDLWVSFLRFCV